MSNSETQTRLSAIGANGYVSADEVMFMRRTVFADNAIDAGELDEIFALARRAPQGDPEWAQFFAEITADFYLREEEPLGYLTADEFADLKLRITKDNRSPSQLDICLLVKLMEAAELTPPEMSGFTGDAIKAAIAGKTGGAVIDKNDTMLIRRYLFAAGGDGNVAVTRREAELLFDINDMADKAGNDPAWTELFVQGIINHLMAHLGYTPPSREEAFRRHAWASDQSSNLGGFFKRMVSGGFSAIAHSSRPEKSFQQEYNEQRDRASAQAERITADEASWLAERIGRDGAFDMNEQKLIDRMRDLEKDLPETLKTLLERAA